MQDYIAMPHVTLATKLRKHLIIYNIHNNNGGIVHFTNAERSVRAAKACEKPLLKTASSDKHLRLVETDANARQAEKLLDSS